MMKVRGLLVGLLVACATATGWAANHVTVESKSVAVGATGVQIGVFVENDIPITALVLPLELREATPGTYVTTAFTFVAQPAGRVQNSPLGPAGANWPGANVTARRYAVTAAPPCSGPVSNTYNTAAAQIDFVSPDAVFHATVSTGDPNIGEDISMDPGADSPGTANASFVFTFNVTGVDGLIEIDTACVRPANHVTYVDENSTAVPVTFTKGIVTVGTPLFPPVVTDIPDQTINEGQTFATIDLNDFVSDLDDPDASLNWTASGQSQLSVSISPAKIATISIPNADWFGSEVITFRATDGDLQFDEDAATFTVNPVNDPPILANITNKTRLSGLTLTFTTAATDVDNPCSEVSFSMLNAPAGATLNNDAPCGATFNWPTVCLDSGVYQVTFVVTDGSLADSQVVQITIQPNPDRFQVNPDSLEFTFAVGQSEPPAQDLNVTDPGCGEMDFEVAVSEPWLLVTPGTGTTSMLLSVDIDTAGLAAGNYTAFITIRQTGVASPESVLVPVALEVTEEICICSCHGDPPPACDGQFNIQSIILVINVAFRGQLDLGEATCPVSFTDVNCDCAVDVLDVIRIVDFIWRQGPPLCDPCTDVTDPCDLVASQEK
jgi:hypothetical protein